MSIHPTRRQRYLALGAFSPILLACLALPTSAAATDAYPPVLPGATQTSAPPAEVLPTRISAEAPSRTTDDTAVLGVRIGSLAATGSDAFPYIAAAGVLVAGGSALLVLGRRKAGAHSDE